MGAWIRIGIVGCQPGREFRNEDQDYTMKGWDENLSESHVGQNTIV